MKPALLAVVVAVALAAHAAHADPRADARVHIASATALHHDGKFADALDELQAAYALDPQPPLLYAMGQLLVALTRCDDAVPYYERYVATHPGADAASLAYEAIANCRRQPITGIATATASPASPTALAMAEPLVMSTARTEPLAITTHLRAEPAAPRWYADHLADGLVAGGLATGIAAALVYRGARADRADADGAGDYAAYGTMVDRAHDLRTGAMIGAALATSLVAAGIVHYVAHAHHGAEHR